MARVNENFLKLKAGYLFPEIARRVRVFSEEEPEKAKKLIRCGIGDVTEPLPLAARTAMKEAIDELGEHGYHGTADRNFCSTEPATGDRLRTSAPCFDLVHLFFGIWRR